MIRLIRRFFLYNQNICVYLQNKYVIKYRRKEYEKISFIDTYAFCGVGVAAGGAGNAAR
jgi:hypothetical protein